MGNTILIPALAIGAIGLLFGIILAVASIVFRVEVDERVPKIVESLPGANCGGCGYSGCQALATAIAAGEAPVSGCPVGGEASATRIAEIMGVSGDGFVKKRAVVRCSGTCEAAAEKYIYQGIEDCRAAAALGGGPKTCQYGCLGLGNCVRACQYGALSIENGIAQIDEEKCVACGQCVAACPKHIIALIPQEKNIVVSCLSKDKGGAMKGVCSVGCIGCKLCEKACESGAITVTDNCASIDADKCTKCGACMEKCPRKIIQLK